MRGAIYLLNKTVEIDEVVYTITNINFILEDKLYNSRFYIELESTDNRLLNMSLKDILPYINEQLIKNGSRNKHTNS